MASAMMEQRELLTELVEACYDCYQAVLQSISPYFFKDRGIYRVDCEDGTSSVLRALSSDVMVPLTQQAALLDYLAARTFSAPQVKRTSTGGPVASYAGWTALMVSFLKGEVSDFAIENLEQLGSLIGSLHVLSSAILIETEGALLPDSRLRPTQYASEAIENLVQVSPHVPQALRPFCEDAIMVLQRVQQAQQKGLLLETIVHGDCWPANAVRTSGGGMALIDWDCAGVGPAILDVGYLLLTCHLGKPQLPAMYPDEQRIAAVVRGYCQQRIPSASELQVLEDAILYDVARGPGQERLLSGLSEGWEEGIRLQKLLVCYHVSARIAAIARGYFE